MKTKKISEINTDSLSWKNFIFLTFDLDWAPDFVLQDTLDLLEPYDISATFFVTHETQLLERIRQNPKYEMGIHPNFDDLILSGPIKGLDNADLRISQLKKIIPEAVSIRSHSTTNSSRILSIAKKHGFTHDCNYLIPYTAQIRLKPWVLWNTMIRCPYFFEDDVSLEYGMVFESMKKILAIDGLKIFDFHPIHLYLNTNSLETYEKSRPFQGEECLLKDWRNPKEGTRDKLIEILKIVSNQQE